MKANTFYLSYKALRYRIFVTTFKFNESMTNEFEGYLQYLAVTSLIIELEPKLKVFWNGGEQGFTKQASKLIKNFF